MRSDGDPPSSSKTNPAWPFPALPTPVHTEGPWKMGMAASGSMVMWPSDQPFPESLRLIEAFRGNKDQMHQFMVTFCRMGYETDERHIYQEGTVRLFNWASGTLAQVHVAGQVAAKLFSGDVAAAWAVGRDFADRLEAATRAAAGS